MKKIVKIQPVKTDYCTYDTMVVEEQTGVMDSSLTRVAMMNSKTDKNEMDGQIISGDFLSLPKDHFAYNPSSYCDKLLPQLEKQGLIEKSEIEDLHSGFNTYPVYQLTEKVLKAE